MHTPSSSHSLIAGFLLLIYSVPVTQCAIELYHGETPGVVGVLDRPMTRESLADFERSLEESSVAANTFRPWMQAVHYFVLNDCGAKVQQGRSGWMFYTPGINTITQRPEQSQSTPHDAIAAVRAFRDELALRGIRLIIVPVPNKESVYPQWLSPISEAPARIINPEMRLFMDECAQSGVETVDLFAVFRTESRVPYYLMQDTHWSPYGLDIAARAVAERIGLRGSAEFETRHVEIEAHGDLVRMQQSPALESRLAAEAIQTTRVLDSSSETATVLVLGDSFSRIFQTDEPYDAGFIAHLAEHLGQPVASLVNDGGGATLVRQELARKPQRLENVQVVVWEFAERDLRLGMEGWQIVPLP
jgi:hypothetical protein